MRVANNLPPLSESARRRSAASGDISFRGRDIYYVAPKAGMGNAEIKIKQMVSMIQGDFESPPPLVRRSTRNKREFDSVGARGTPDLSRDVC